MPSKSMTIPLPRELAEIVEGIAKRNKIKVNTVIRTILEWQLKIYQKGEKHGN